jgi:hypothetical protein
MRGKPSPPGRERDRSYKRRKRGWGRDIDGGKAAGKQVENRENAADNEYHISGKPEPFEHRISPTGNELQRPSIEIAAADRVIQLNNSQREEGSKYHPGQS